LKCSRSRALHLKPAHRELYKFDTKRLTGSILTYSKRTAATPERQEIFMDQNGAGCIKCHKIGNDGGDVGPSLAGVGSKYPRDSSSIPPHPPNRS